jgi:hypothetical protein
MLALLGTIFGLLGSFFPELLKFFKAKEDHRHELEVLKVQAEMAKSEHVYKLEEINAQADISETAALYKFAEVKPSGVPWIDAIINFYSGTVRPTITYVFMAAYCLVKYGQYKVAISVGSDAWSTVVQLWNGEDMAIFSAILAFWFGSRMLKYSMNRIDSIQQDTNGKSNGHSQPGLVPIDQKPISKPQVVDNSSLGTLTPIDDPDRK